VVLGLFVFIPEKMRLDISESYLIFKLFKDYACSRADGKNMNGRELRVSIAKYRRPLDEGRDRDRLVLYFYHYGGEMKLLTSIEMI
jgi:hypothetical protein